MSHSVYLVRRATVDDLGALLALWASMRLPTAELERRLTEFQLVESEDGTLHGAMGLEIIERHGRLHSEGFNDFAVANALREQLWERMQSVAANHGLVRLWTNESAPFWKYNGFQPADAETLKRLPSIWAGLSSDWLTLELRDEKALQYSLEMQFARLKEEEKQRMAETLRRARILNYLAVTLVIIVAIAGILFCVYLLKNNTNLLRR